MDLVIPYPDATQVDATPAMEAQVNDHQLWAHTLWRMICSEQTATEWPVHSVEMLFLHSEMERHQNVRGIRQVFHITWSGTNASRVLGQINAGEAFGWASGGVSRLSMGLL